MKIPRAMRLLEDKYLEFGDGEPAASTYAAVVFDTWAADDRSELIDWARCECYGFNMASVSSAKLPAGLSGWISWVRVPGES